MADYHLDADEQIVEKINRYWIDFLPVVISGTLIIFVAFGGLVAFSHYRDQLPAFVTPDVVGILAASLLAIVLLMIVSAIYVYRHNYLVITNRHLIKVQQNGLFARQTAELGLGNIEDVKGSRSGILGMMLNYGEVEIQTAGARENFIFTTVHYPQLFADRLLQYKEEFRQHHHS